MYKQVAILGTLASASAALSLSGATTAWAQEATNAPAAALADALPWEPLTAQPATLFRSFRLGPVDVQPRCKVGVIYDDNILIQPASAHPKSDVIWFARPAFLAVAGDRASVQDHLRRNDQLTSFAPATFILAAPETWPGAACLLDYGPKFNAFTLHPENDSIDQFLTFNGFWPLGRTLLGVQQEYVWQYTTIVEADRRTWQETIPTSLSGACQLSEKTSAEVSLRRTAVSYEEPDLASYVDWNWDTWLNYQYSPRLNLSLGVNVGKVDLDSQPGQTYETPLARARYHYGARLLLDGSAGVQLRQYASGMEPTTEPVCEIGVSYLFSEDRVLRLSGFRRELPSVSRGYDYIATGLSFGTQQRFGDRYVAGLELTYYTSDYRATLQPGGAGVGSHRQDQYFEVRPALDLRFTRHFYGRLFYLFRTVQSDQWEGWTDNQVGSELTWTF